MMGKVTNRCVGLLSHASKKHNVRTLSLPIPETTFAPKCLEVTPPLLTLAAKAKAFGFRKKSGLKEKILKTATPWSLDENKLATTRLGDQLGGKSRKRHKL
jgi:hypothetical protein